MAGLMDWIKTPEGQGLLSAAFAGMAGAQRGTPWNNVGRAGVAGLMGYQNTIGRQQDEEKNALLNDQMRLQMDELKRKNQEAEAARKVHQEFYSPKHQESGYSISSNSPVSFEQKPASLPSLPVSAQLPAKSSRFQEFISLGDAYRAKGLPTQAQQAYDMAEKFRPKYAAGIHPAVVNGKTVYVQTSETEEPRVLSGLEVPSDSPSAVKEYEYARKQGYGGSLQDWQLSQRRASAPSVAVNMSDPTAVAKAALSFQKDYRDATKDSFTRASAYNAMIEASKDPSPKGDLTMVYSFIKALDPTSVVREGEITLVNANRSIPDRIKGYANRLAQGQSLLPNERADLINQAKHLSTTDYQRSRNDIKAFRDNAKRLQLDPELYAPDPYKGMFDDGGNQPKVKRYNPQTGRIE